ncbi:ABC transporter permease [uncultured Faecalibaculum sp.]|uniref:ABC transporter permease n=1 Tax=uncultured Faecalibaculum sp. TaxID=1729681 RepID=UPI0025F85C6B|nr:ABC transporter permease [uncultured Faecalibaculum sp.]
MSTGVIIRAVELGLIFSVLSLGEYITVKVMDSPDLTVDGSFVTGGCTAAMLTLAGYPNLGLAAAFAAGLLCGCVTAFLQTKMKIQGLLAGILTMTGLYSINLRIMQGAPNVSLHAVPKATILANPATVLYVLIAIVAVIVALMYVFFKTNLGLMLRAAGDNEEMIRSSSVNVDAMKFLGFALSNGLVALSGALLVQFQKFADVTGGTGMLVLGLAGIIIGEAIFRRSGIGFGLAASVTGAILYRLLYTFALQLGFPATDMNLVSAVLVAITISIPHLQKLKKKRGSHA